MVSAKRSSEMSQDELYAQAFKCPDCDRQGYVSGHVADKNFTLAILEGLDLVNCEGCRLVLGARGGGPVGQLPSEQA